MEIQISFQKKKFSKETEDYLCSRLDKDTEADLIHNLRELASLKVKKLKSQDANDLLIRIIQAIIINDDLEETINSSAHDTENDNEPESESEDDKGGDKTIIVLNKNDPPQGTSKQNSPELTPISTEPGKVDEKSSQKIKKHQAKIRSNNNVIA